MSFDSGVGLDNADEGEEEEEVVDDIEEEADEEEIELLNSRMALRYVST